MVAPPLSVRLTAVADPDEIDFDAPEKVIVPAALSSSSMPVWPLTPCVMLPDSVMFCAVAARSWMLTAWPVPLMMLPP